MKIMLTKLSGKLMKSDKDCGNRSLQKLKKVLKENSVVGTKSAIGGTKGDVSETAQS
jgi:hypothetical protein